MLCFRSNFVGKKFMVNLDDREDKYCAALASKGVEIIEANAITFI